MTDPAAVVALLRERGETVATAESLTAGLVTAALTSVQGSSAVVRGGLVVYATDLKHALAGVDEALLAEHGAVHPEVARQLAVGARTRCGATWGLGLTGVAGPDPQDGVAPGTVHVAVAGAAGTSVETMTLGGDRHEVRAASVVGALTLLVNRLTSTSG
ncbi:CinA family protein [Umezawaea endophytica]|uniref:CinA family protein n=1 Tax=Umezawaea endophytica TaxID=1654476 RepID=A0A9X2VL24_9PSEU|nr:CinA family protein [Umezawaea endophytica]MCS7478384.1 CinA family protein [Umezawaea endophytica]